MLQMKTKTKKNFLENTYFFVHCISAFREENRDQVFNKTSWDGIVSSASTYKSDWSEGELT